MIFIGKPTQECALDLPLKITMPIDDATIYIFNSKQIYQNCDIITSSDKAKLHTSGRNVVIYQFIMPIGNVESMLNLTFIVISSNTE